jgi:hypothetical protein
MDCHKEIRWASLYLLLTFAVCNTPTLFSQLQKTEQFGSLSLLIKGGNPASPSFTVLSPSLQSRVAFRGQIKQIIGNRLIFHKVPDVLDPANTDKAPFNTNQFVAQKARLKAHLSGDANGTLDRIDVLNGGVGFLQAPSIFIGLPESGSSRGLDYEPAEAKASIDANGTVSSVHLTSKGKGYVSAPTVNSDGGVHFVRLIDEESNKTGRFYRIQANTNDTITLSNSYSEDLNDVFFENAMIEIFASWTLGDLFGYDNVQLNSGNFLSADTIYLKRDSLGTDDYDAFFHDGNSWADLSDPSLNADNQIINPGEAIVLARRSIVDLNLVFSGNALTQSTMLEIPASGKSSIVNNPFAVDMMLSDLIASQFITTDPSNTFSWFADAEQEVADNVKVLTNNVWTTYWHDGTNRSIASKAWASARAGSGVGASMTQLDISMVSGGIESITNDTGAIVITSTSHGLLDGFVVKVSGARGRKTNSDKDQVDENNNVVADGSGLVIESSANGYHSILVLDQDRFQLVDRYANSDYIQEAAAHWATGDGGSGYSQDAAILFVGGGGQGGRGKARVENGKVVSITITEPGAGYVESPEILFSLGGWRKLGGGNTPQNDVLIPAGSGIMLVRNNPFGVATRIQLKSPL